MKKIYSILISTILVVVAMFIGAINAHAETQVLDLIVTPDKTVVSVGDEVTYTVSLGSVDNLECIQFKIIPPQGLTFKSGALVDGLKESLNAVVCGFNPTKLNVVAGVTHYSSTEIMDVLVLTFIVEEDFAGDPITTDDWYNYAEDNTGEIKIELVTPHDVDLKTTDDNISNNIETEKSTVNILWWLIEFLQKIFNFLIS